MKLWQRFISKYPNNKYIISSDTGLAPNKPQAVICTNEGLTCWRIYVSLDLDDLTNEISKHLFTSLSLLSYVRIQ